MALESQLRVYGQRLTALRHIFGLSQTRLASKLNVTQSFLSQIERGNRPVPEPLIVHASTEFALPISFFVVAPSPLDSGPVTFRKTARATVRDEERVSGLYTEASRLFHMISEKSGYVPVNLPEPRDYNDDPEQVAVALRQSAGLTEDEPVLNVTRCLERMGIGVVDQLDSHNHEGGHTGVSRPSHLNHRPLVALAESVPGAVKRLTLLHEVYHLIADRDLVGPITSTRSSEEQRAFRFAAAFLLPEPVVRKRISESLNLHGYLPIKADYGISVPAVIRRAKDLGVISKDRYRSLSIQLSSQGWRTNEPVEVADEKPLLVTQALQKVYGSQPIARASHDIGVAPEWIHRWTSIADEAAPVASANIINFAAVRRRNNRREMSSMGEQANKRK